MQSQLPILLAEYTFRSRRDVTDYLALLDQVDDYFASLLLYEQEKAAAGFLMPDISLEKVQKQCDTIVTIQELAQGTHFLQTTFEDRLVELQAQGILSAEVVSSFLKENDRLLTTVVQPAYATLSEGLYSLETSGSAGQTSSISQASPGGIIDTPRPAERSRPVAGWEDLLSPPAFRRDRFLPFGERTGANASGAISGGTGGHPQPDTTVPFSAFHAFRRDHGRFSHPGTGRNAFRSTITLDK